MTIQKRTLAKNQREIRKTVESIRVQIANEQCILVERTREKQKVTKELNTLMCKVTEVATLEAETSLRIKNLSNLLDTLKADYGLLV